MSNSRVCRPYQEGDESGILELYRQVFHFDLTPDFWRWMYQQSPTGPAIIAVVESSGRIVGHYGIQPREFWIGPRRSVLGLAVGAMLLPEARNVATFVELAQLARDLARRQGFPGIYAFPNEASYRVHCSLLSWRALPQIVELDGPLPPSQPQVADVRVWREMPLELEFDTIDAQANRQPICSARSTAWLRWRFFDRPGGEYVLHTLADEHRVTAYAVTKRYVRDAVRYGHILDWRVLPQVAHRQAELLASVWRQLGEWSVDRVSTWAVGQHGLAAGLSVAGLTQTGRKTNFCSLEFDSRETDAQLHPANWQCEMADSDVY